MSGAEFKRFPGGAGSLRNKAGEVTAPPTFVVCPRCKGPGQRSTAFGDIGIDPCVPCSGSGTVPRPTITDPTISCENNTGHGADGGVEVPRPTIPGGATPKPRATVGGFLLFTLTVAIFKVQKAPEYRRYADEVRTPDSAKAVVCAALPGAVMRLVRAPGICVLALIFLCSCGPRKVLTSLNAFEYHNARQSEECAVSTPACDCRWEALFRWDKLLHEAGKAVKNGGAYPLQLKALKEAEAAYGACK